MICIICARLGRSRSLMMARVRSAAFMTIPYGKFPVSVSVRINASVSVWVRVRVGIRLDDGQGAVGSVHDDSVREISC